jgi:dihydrofolate reductase
VSAVAGYRIEGHAIVSADGRIAGPDGYTPDSLNNEADWLRFQAALDLAAVVVVGRHSHAANPNTMRRNRLVVSSSARGVERRSDAWWWNPAEASLATALKNAAPRGGVVAVPGGRLVFDLFLEAGYDAFHLARVGNVTIPGGLPLFTAIGTGETPGTLLAAAGLEPGPTEMLDPEAGVTLVTWRRGVA